MDDGRERSAIRHLAFDAFGHQLVVGQHVVLEVPVLAVGTRLGARLHGRERSHAAVALVLLAVDEDELARTLFDAGEQAAEHDGVGTDRDRLRDVAGVLEATVADDGNTGRPARLRGLVDRGHLRDADTGDDPRRADRTGPDPDLDAVGTRVDQRLRAFSGRDVAADDVDGDVALQPADHLENARRVPVRGVDDQDVDAGFDQRARPLVRVFADAHSGRHQQPARVVLRCERELLALGEVLHRDEPAQPAGVVDKRQLLDLVVAQQIERVVVGDADPRGDQRHRRHHVAHRL